MMKLIPILPPLSGSVSDVIENICSDFGLNKDCMSNFFKNLEEYDYESANKTRINSTSALIFSALVDEFEMKPRQFANLLRTVDKSYADSEYIPMFSANTNIVIASLSNDFNIKPGRLVNFLNTIKSY